MINILTADEIEKRIKNLPDTEWHVDCSSSDVLTPRDEKSGEFNAFPIMGMTKHEPGGGCIAHSHPAPQCFYITGGKALFQVGKGKVDNEKIRKELGWEVIIDDRTE